MIFDQFTEAVLRFYAKPRPETARLGGVQVTKGDMMGLLGICTHVETLTTRTQRFEYAASLRKAKLSDAQRAVLENYGIRMKEYQGTQLLLHN